MDQTQQANPQMKLPYYYMPPQKSRWWIPVLIIVLIVALFFAAILAFSSTIDAFFSKKVIEVKPNSVLHIDLNKEIDEYSKSGFFELFTQNRKAAFFDIITLIKRAKTDSRIKGIYLTPAGGKMGYAKSTEILEALEDFKTSGKFVIAYLENGNETDYYKALAADKIYMPSEGFLLLNGFSISTIFFKDLANKLGIDFYVEQCYDFKSAGEIYSRNKFSDSTRLEYKVYLDYIFNNFVDSVVSKRKINRELVTSALSRGVYSPDSLLALGFVDELLFESDVKDIMKKKVFADENTQEKLNLVPLDDYVNAEPEKLDYVAEDDKQLAIIFAVGPIMTEKTGNLFSDDKTITSKQYIKYLRAAREDKNIKVIILRIDSPGGSALASEEIRNEIIKTRKVKPVYASMSDVAGSGGYWIAMDCDTIIAHPSTLTGSIGVISMIPNINRLLKDIHLSVDTISTGPAANYPNFLLPTTDKEKQELRKMTRQIYDKFVNLVATARKKSYDEIHSIAKGRIWVGADAYKLGLVDVLGGIQTAINLAKQRMNIAPEVAVKTKIYPKPEEDLETLLSLFGLQRDEDTKIQTTENSLIAQLSYILGSTTLIPNELKFQLAYFASLLSISEKENVIVAMPSLIEIK